MIVAFLKAASLVSTEWRMAAFAIAAVLFLVTRRQKGAARIGGNAALVVITLLAVVPILSSAYVALNGPSIYQLRAVVLDPQQIPVDDARVWSSVGGEPKRVTGGWQFDIPAASIPADHRVTIYATRDSAFLKGQRQMTLASDFHPTATIYLTSAETSIRGIVTDGKGRAVGGADVSVVGYGSQMVRTNVGGGFELPAHAADGQQVELHVEKTGFEAGGGWYPAGSAPAEVVLNRR